MAVIMNHLKYNKSTITSLLTYLYAEFPLTYNIVCSGNNYILDFEYQA